MLSPTDLEFALTLAVIPLTLLLLVMAAFAVRRESKYLIWAFDAGLILGCAYFVFKVDPSALCFYILLTSALSHLRSRESCSFCAYQKVTYDFCYPIGSFTPNHACERFALSKEFRPRSQATYDEETHRQ